jgi:hypothetical protein
MPLKKISEAMREHKMECFTNGILEYWVSNPSFHHSNPDERIEHILPQAFGI